MTTLPTPNNFLRKTNSLLFSFLWDDKPDKIKRETICQDYHHGGLKMINIYHFEKALKINWIKRVFTQTDAQWQNLFRTICLDPNNLLKFGGSYSLTLKKRTQNLFWQKIFEYWNQFCYQIEITSNEDISHSCIWYNPQISKEDMYYPTWAKKGILFVGDILTPNGEIMQMNEIKTKFNLLINHFYYYRIKSLLRDFIKLNQKAVNFSITQPFYPVHLPYVSSTCGSKIYYKLFNNKAGSAKTANFLHSKWANLLCTSETTDIWPLVFKACFKSVLDNKVIWLQYRILYNVLPTRDFLYKIKMIDNNLCVFCHSYPETVMHLFCECDKVIDLWHNVKQWLNNKAGININFDNSVKLLGYYKADPFYWPSNFVILLTKKYIFSCARKGNKLNIYNLQSEFF